MSSSCGILGTFHSALSIVSCSILIYWMTEWRIHKRTSYGRDDTRWILKNGQKRMDKVGGHFRWEEKRIHNRLIQSSRSGLNVECLGLSGRHWREKTIHRGILWQPTSLHHINELVSWRVLILWYAPYCTGQTAENKIDVTLRSSGRWRIMAEAW